MCVCECVCDVHVVGLVCTFESMFTMLCDGSLDRFGSPPSTFVLQCILYGNFIFYNNQSL